MPMTATTEKRLRLFRAASTVSQCAWLISRAYACRLTSRAQARGTNQREPRSGTESAIPRCLQRIVDIKFYSVQNQVPFVHGTWVCPSPHRYVGPPTAKP